MAEEISTSLMRMGTLQTQRIVLIAVLTALTLTFVKAFCASPQGPEVSSYGHKFLIPFPEVLAGQSSTFTFRMLIINPSDSFAVVSVTLTDASNTSSTTVYNLVQFTSEMVAVPYAYMVKGEDTFYQHVEVTSSDAISVQVQGNSDMDGFVALPVESWDTDYRPVTYWIEFGGKSVLTIIAEVATTVTITIPEQNTNHLYVFDTINPAIGETKVVTLEPGEVYQLKRSYDISGCHVSSSGRIGVVSGSDFSWIGTGSRQGAFYDWVPGTATLGTDFVVPLTPGRGTLGDLVQVMAVHDDTYVIISTDFRRIVLSDGMSIIRKFINDLVHVMSDQPIVVVKFSQSGGIQGVTGHPTMTYIPPTDLYLNNTRYVVPEMVGFTSMTQLVVVVGTSVAVQCVSDALSITSSQKSLYGTNMASQTFTVNPGDGYLSFICASSTERLSVYSYFVSDEMSFQVSVAYSQQIINPGCIITYGSPGDHIDNDCDGQRDEDRCTTAGSTDDCEPEFSGHSVDVFGTTFTFLIPEHCSGAESVTLMVTSEGQSAIDITVTSPLIPNHVDISDIKPAGQYGTHIALFATGLQASGSKVFDSTLLLTAAEEVSVTLEMACPGSADISALTTRLIPNEGLGLEYFAITVCNTGNCRIQISAAHFGTTNVNIRIRLDGGNSLMFEDKLYMNGDLICIQLEQFQSAQVSALQGDLTGTHILANKPVAVMSGGQLTNFINNHIKDGLIEMLPPVHTWGITHYLLQTPAMMSLTQCTSFPCKDYMKIVASENDISVKLSYGSAVTYHMLHQAGDHLLVKLPDVFVKVDTSGSVLIFQLTQELLFGLEVSASLVIPPRQWYRGDTLPVPAQAGPAGMSLYLLLVSNQVGIAVDDVSVDNEHVLMTEEPLLNSSYARKEIFPLGDVVSIVFRGGTSVGGQLHAVGGGMGDFYPLAFSLDTINDGCVVTRGVRGDMIDNDCDGHIDEEVCITTDLADDSDEDGMLNEDCAEDVAQTTLLTPTQIMMTSGNIVVSSANIAVPTTLPYADLSSQPHLHSSEILSITNEALPTSSETLQTSSQILQTSSQILQTSSQILQTSSQILPTSSQILPTSSEMLPISSEKLPKKSAMQPLSSEILLVQSSITPTSSSESSTTSETPALTGATDLSSSFSTSEVVQSSWSVIPASKPASGTMCSCQCPNDLLSTPLDSSQIEQMTSSIQKELYVDESKVSATKRKYISVSDPRPSAQTVGYFGVCIVAVTFSGIFLMDIGSLARDIMELVNAFKHGE